MAEATTGRNSNAPRLTWQKPAVRVVSTVNRTAGGAVISGIENIFYNPS